jgi:DNA-binding response OmpR family regulator
VTSRDLDPVSGPGRDDALVVVAEHEPEVAEMARRYLRGARLPALVTASPEEAIALLRSRLAAVYVLDLTMPGLDIRLIRRSVGSGPPAAVVFLMDPRAARPRGLGTGPGSRRWLVRPFSPRALVDSVRETLIPSQPPAPADPGQGLTAGEAAVLAALERAGGRVLTRQQLVAAVSAGRSRIPGPRVIDVYVTQLRAKLGTNSIRTIRGAGYALAPPRPPTSPPPPDLASAPPLPSPPDLASVPPCPRPAPRGPAG